MEKTYFPNVIIVDIQSLALSFIGLYKPNDYYLCQEDIEFVGKILHLISPAFNYEYYAERMLNDRLKYIADGTILYSEEHYNPSQLSTAVYKFGISVMDLLHSLGAYINGVFPYAVKEFTFDNALVFEYSPMIFEPRRSY